MTKEDALAQIVKQYLSSHDFNGFPVRLFPSGSGAKRGKLESLLSALINEGAISLNFGDVHPNPHIKALPEHLPEKQIEKLKTADLQHVCAYPTTQILKKVAEISKYEGKPFTLRLALGEPQLAFESFDLSVLEIYRNDPRYSYTNDDISGHISVTAPHYESDVMAKADKVFLETFGFSYDENRGRAVAVFLRYLADLSPGHQQIWNAKIVRGNFRLHPDYFRTSVMGNFPEGVSIFTALLEEQKQINDICKLMGRPPLFKDVFTGDKRPRNFGFLIRPTLKEFHDFVHLLDKLISENINRDFFGQDVETSYDEVRADGKVVVREKGSIRLLEEWLRKRFRVDDTATINDIFLVFKKVRELRRRPAHALDDDKFDQKYIGQQRELVGQCYDAVRLLRLIFSSHPKTKNNPVPRWLEEAKVWAY